MDFIENNKVRPIFPDEIIPDHYGYNKHRRVLTVVESDAFLKESGLMGDTVSSIDRFITIHETIVVLFYCDTPLS
jgi:hypothetical protein